MQEEEPMAFQDLFKIGGYPAFIVHSVDYVNPISTPIPDELGEEKQKTLCGSGYVPLSSVGGLLDRFL